MALSSMTLVISPKTTMPIVDDLTSVLSRIEKYLKGICINISPKCKKVKEFLENNPSICETVMPLFVKLYEVLPLFTSGETSQLLLGVVEVVSLISVTTCIGGPAVSVICSLLSRIIRCFGGNKIAIGKVVESEIRKIFHGHSNESLLEEAADLHLMYQLAFSFLSSTDENSDCSEHDITNMNIQLNVFQGAPFLRKLGKLVRELAKEQSGGKKDYAQANKAKKAKKAMEFIELYVKLASLRDMILGYFYTIANSTEHSQRLARGLHQVIASFDEQDRETLGMFLKPTSEYVYIVSYIQKEEHELSMKFLMQKKLVQDHSNLTHVDYKFSSCEWTSYHAVRLQTRRLEDFGDMRHVRGSDEVAGRESKFGFKRLSNGYFRITHRGISGEFLRMTATSPHHWVMSVEQCPSHEESEWKVIQMENGNYVFSPRAYPDFFMGMSVLWTGSVAGFLGGYNKQCQWNLHRL